MRGILRRLTRFLRDDSASLRQHPKVDLELCARAFFSDNSNFSVAVEKSRIIDAGKGVIASGRIPKHSIVSFYPGFYYPPPPTAAIMSSSGDNCLKASEISSVQSIYRISCPQVGGSLDSTTFARSNLPSFCDGDIVNHPPSGAKPNVFPVDFSWNALVNSSQGWDSRSRERLSEYAQSVNRIGEGIWYVDGATFEPIYYPTDGGKLPCAGIALVTLSDVEDGSELLMDYQFDLDGEVPEWYTPVDYSGKHSRLWTTVGRDRNLRSIING